jgi:pimeloyl-ACP methyl ester carboxylesterase
LAQLAHASKPVLLGQGDPRVTPPPTASSRGFPALEPVAIPRSQLKIFEGVGHYPRCEEPARFVDVLTEFFESTAPARITAAPRRVLRSTGS